MTAVVGDTGVTELSDDVFAAAVALRAITKTGKFGAKGAAPAPATEAIGGAASGAVNKLLGALMYAIKSGVEKDIKKIQESIAKIKSDGSSKKTDIVKEDTKKAEATTAKSYGASANNDKDIKAIVGKTTEKNLADDVFSAAALKAITDNIAGADAEEATIAPSGAVDGPDATAAKDKIKEEAGKIAGAIKEIITLVLPDAKPGTGKSEVVKAPKKATAGDAITLFATGTGDHTKATETAGNAAATIVAKATGEGMLKAIADDATAEPTKAVRLAGGYAAKQASGATNGTDDDNDIEAIVGNEGTDKKLEDDIFAGAVALQQRLRQSLLRLVLLTIL
ncbi:hypothetical protein DB313_05950 (plasmid) [Borrelia turcica IST7]|uniref:Variable large protein n=1 Tax=Borrelia turcica IST7 TaxID=1104446 RepID=A0A386PRB2_9SPIR|nr:variable large family protein [Borrelia turcica]AYE37040.1 hypothetical protein DB313_05950 [Borrelia turcica IST7]